MESGPQEDATQSGLNRRVFLKNSAGAAGGVAVTITPAAAIALAAAPQAAASEKQAQVVPHPTDDVQGEPITAYVHNAERQEVTVIAGTSEVTYRDPVLTQRLLDAAKRHSN